MIRHPHSRHASQSNHKISASESPEFNGIQGIYHTMHASWLASHDLQTYAASILGACIKWNKIIVLQDTIKTIGR
jgi:hypothetical protein